MFDSLLKYKQLLFTIFLAFFIIASFIYISNSFANIAKRALEDSIQVRIGALNDAVAPLISVIFTEKDLIEENLDKIAKLNNEIDWVQVIVPKNGKYEIIHTQKERNIYKKTQVIGYDDIIGKAIYNPDTTFFKEIVENGEKKFVSARLIDKKNNSILLIKHGLTGANKQVIKDINKTIAVLIIIIVFLIILFMRHAKIIDYTHLYFQLKKIDQMKDDFISIASHELRTPLTAIRGYIELLEDSIKNIGNTDDELNKFIERIKLSTKSLSDLVDDILDVSRIQQGRIKFDMEIVNPGSIINDLVEQLKIPAENKGLSIIKDIQNDIYIYVDKQRFRQILTNIIGNSIKYTKEGSIKVTLKKDGNFAMLSIKDTGIGMTQDELNHLFDKFWRSSSAEARSQKGTGLGMWITKQLVDHMNGKIKVLSQKGVGTEFILFFPVVRKD